LGDKLAKNKKQKNVAVLALKSPVKAVDFPEEMAVSLARRFPDVAFHLVPFHNEKIDYLVEADILYSYTITPQLLAGAPKLKWFHSVVTGPDTYTFPELIGRKIKVTSPRGVYSIPMAETILGLMLSLTRKIRDSVLLQSVRQWSSADIYDSLPVAGELFGSTAVIVGLGGIGSELAKRCKSLGMKVVGIVPTEREKPSFADEMMLTGSLSGAISRADYLVLACPLTKKTKGIIGRNEIRKMKKTAYLINVARGELIDEKALADALKSQTIGGAACDVFSTEPLPPDHPFYSVPNMIVMPHVSGWSSRFWERAVERFAFNLELFLKGKTLIGEVNFERGY
jgi:phosphoglycerate dehydrogenase-like enzyme